MPIKQVKAKIGDDNNDNETITIKSSVDSDDENDDKPQRADRSRGYDMEQLDFCHHCLQLKQTQIHVRCRYQSNKHRVNYPSS